MLSYVHCIGIAPLTLSNFCSQLGRQKAALAEELIKSRKELERQSDTIVRIAKEKEELTQDKAELAVQLTASERENRYV